MSTFEDEQDKLGSYASFILLVVFAIGFIGWGIFCIVTKFSFSTNTVSNTIDYYKGYQAVGQGIISIAFGLAFLAGLFWALMKQAHSQIKYRFFQIIAVVLSVSVATAVVVGLPVLYKVI